MSDSPLLLTILPVQETEACGLSQRITLKQPVLFSGDENDLGTESLAVFDSVQYSRLQRTSLILFKSDVRHMESRNVPATRAFGSSAQSTSQLP